MPKRDKNRLPTIWNTPDALWEPFLKPLLDEFNPAPKTGRPRADARRCLDGIIYRARTGCQWNHLPKEFGDDATVHRTLQRWERLSIFDKLWALLIYHCEELGAVHWEWQAADGMLNKARFIGNGQKGGTKRASQVLGRPQKCRTMRERQTVGSAPTPRIAGKWASKPACLSRSKVARSRSASLERT